MPGLLKRKRSDSELSLASSSGTGSQFSSPPRPLGAPSHSFDFSMDDRLASPFFSSNATSIGSRATTPAHLPSRTLKRFRDSRPSDEEVHRKFYEWRAHHRGPVSATPSPLPPAVVVARAHPTQNESERDSSSPAPMVFAEHTLGLLYAAQQQHQHLQQQQQTAQQTLPVAAQPPPAASTNGGDAHSQRSLHSFWSLPSSAPTPMPAALAAPSVRGLPPPSSCEDCGLSLTPSGGDDGDAMMLDMDYCGAGEGGNLCGACGKAVCFSCSVGSLGPERRCLVCAGRKVWIGGIGWTAGPEEVVGVC